MKKIKKSAAFGIGAAVLCVCGYAYANMWTEEDFGRKKANKLVQKVVLTNTAWAGNLQQEQVLQWLKDNNATALLPEGFVQLNDAIRGQKIDAIGTESAMWLNWNPQVNRYFSLIYKQKQQWVSVSFENPLYENGALKAKMDSNGSYEIGGSQGGGQRCNIKSIVESETLQKSKEQPYIPVCEGVLWYKKTVRSYRSNVESATDLLRSTGSAGESIINVYKNLFAAKGEQVQEIKDPNAHAISNVSALVLQGAKNVDGIKVSTGNLGITLEDESGLVRGQIDSARWYSAYYDDQKRRWAQLTVPQHLGVSGGGSDRLVYSMAFKLDDTVSLEYGLGFDHPSLGWSSRPKVARSGAGPDGFSNDGAMVRSGVIAPWKMEQTLVVFAGGFKREHSAFRASEKATTNNGHHYGMMEGGVVRSKLHPDLATIWGNAKGEVFMGAWSEQKQLSNPAVRFARQNGLMLVENGVVSPHVDNLLAGNWSGNAQGDILTMRSALCLTKNSKQENIVVYSVFTLATPKVMGQTLLAMGCQNAMQLDMNAPTLTYGAFAYKKPTQSGLLYEPLMKSMVEESKTRYGRFISMPDSRDFFSLTYRVDR